MMRIRPAWRPNTFSSASEISPTVAFARAAAIDRASRLSSCERGEPSATRRGGVRQRRQRGVDGALVALLAQPAQLVQLLRADAGVVDLAGRRSPRRTSVTYLLTPITGWRPESIRAWVRAAASSTRSFGMPASMACGHPAGLLDLGDVRPRPPRQVVGQPLDVVAAAPRVDHLRRARLLLQQQLGVAGDPRGEVGRQRQRLVQRVGVQRLGVALGGGHRLDAGAHHVVEHVLRGQRPARGLASGCAATATSRSSARTGAAAWPTAAAPPAASRPP